MSGVMLKRLLAFVALVLVGIAHAQAGEPARLALLVGNKAYSEKIGPLKNPHDDVALIEASLKKLGFTVTVLKDADYRAMDKALKRYVREVNRAGPGTVGSRARGRPRHAERHASSMTDVSTVCKAALFAVR